MLFLAFMLFPGMPLQSEAADLDCTIRVVQNGHEIIPVIDRKIATYKLKADTFRIEVNKSSCSPGIFPIANSKDIDYLLQTPLMFTSGGFGLAESPETSDIFFGGYAKGEDPSASIDEFIQKVSRKDVEKAMIRYKEFCGEEPNIRAGNGTSITVEEVALATNVYRCEGYTKEIPKVAQDIEWAKNLYKQLCSELTYCPKPVKPYARHWPFVDPNSKGSRNYAVFKRWTANSPMTAAAGMRHQVVIYSSVKSFSEPGSKFASFKLVRPTIAVFDFQGAGYHPKQFPVGELSFTQFFAQRTGDNSTYCLLGNGFIRTIRSSEESAIISEWLQKHPEAKVIPVSILEEGTRVPFIYIWIADGAEILNLELIRKGAFPGSVMLDAVHFDKLSKNSPDHAHIEAAYDYAKKSNKIQPEIKNVPPRRLIPDADYEAFLKKLQLAQEYAQKEKNGIWADKYKHLRAE